MKKVLLLLLLITCAISIKASIIDSIQYRDDKVIIEEVVNIPKANASQLYGKAKLFFSKVFNSSKGAIDSEDLENHIIIGKGTVVDREDQGFGGIYYNFTIIIQAKDERYRYTITDMCIDMTGLAPMKITAEYSAKVAKEKGTMESMNSYYDKIAPIISILKEQMSVTEDNW